MLQKVRASDGAHRRVCLQPGTQARGAGFQRASSPCPRFRALVSQTPRLGPRPSTMARPIEETTGKMKPPDEEAGLISRPLLGCQHQRDPVSNSQQPRGCSVGAPSFQAGHQGREGAGRAGGAEGGGSGTQDILNLAAPPLKLQSKRSRSPFTFGPVALIHLPPFYKHLKKGAGITKGRLSQTKDAGLQATGCTQGRLFAGPPSAPTPSDPA